MSNERSPREVCSITMGINGLISGWLLATGGPQFRLGGRLFLVWRPDGLAGGSLLGRYALDLAGNAVEGTGEAHVLALRVVCARSMRLLDDLVRLLEAVAEGLVDLLVRNLDPELVGGGLEHELSGHGSGRLVLQAPDEILRRVAGHLDVGLEGATAALEDRVQLAHERPRAGFDQRPGYLDLRRLDEPVERSASESLVDLGFDLLADPLLDIRTELFERVELGGGASEAVVELRQHLLLDLLHDRLDLDRLRFAGCLELDLLRLAGIHPDELFLELRNQPARAELDDVVALAAVVGNEIDDHRVAERRGASLGRGQLRDCRAEDVELVLDEVVGDGRFDVRHLQLRPVGHLRLWKNRDGRGEAPVLVLGVG